MQQPAEPGQPLMTPWVIRVVATLGLADLMAEGVSRLEDLSARTRTHTESLGRLLRYLTCRGVFAEPEPGRFVLNDEALPFLDGHPDGLRARLDLTGAVGRIDQTFSHLLETIRTGRPAYAIVHGRPFFDDLQDDPERSASFDALMRRRSSQDLPLLLDGFDWAAVRSVADVGGGTGALLAGLLRAHPGLRGTLVERPMTAERAAHTMREAGVDDRCDLVAGDFFQPLPAGHDVYLLRNVICDWDDARAAAILRRCGQAAGPDGRVLVMDQVLADDADRCEVTASDLYMLLVYGGKERELAEFDRLAAAAGLRLGTARPTRSTSWLLEMTVSQGGRRP
ncbi:methyltransferase [Nonomuraea sp. NPDC000554]|uniref:methyltransferase n=1 Tax=Nonomuraea sp. NPDC000554 TaxID=3154259 RepID=UPI003322D0F8